MRIRRSFPIFVGVLLVAAALTIIVQLRKHAPPEPARLLPGADGFLYVNLKWMRRINTGAQLPPVSHDPNTSNSSRPPASSLSATLTRQLSPFTIPRAPALLNHRALQKFSLAKLTERNCGPTCVSSPALQKIMVRSTFTIFR